MHFPVLLHKLGGIGFMCSSRRSADEEEVPRNFINVVPNNGSLLKPPQRLISFFTCVRSSHLHTP